MSWAFVFCCFCHLTKLCGCGSLYQTNVPHSGSISRSSFFFSFLSCWLLYGHIAYSIRPPKWFMLWTTYFPVYSPQFSLYGSWIFIWFFTWGLLKHIKIDLHIQCGHQNGRFMLRTAHFPACSPWFYCMGLKFSFLYSIWPSKRQNGWTAHYSVYSPQI